MENMFRKVDARERIVGFYSTGPKVRSNDLKINELFRKYVAHPVFVIIDVRTDFEGVPIKAYTAVEALQEDGKETRLEFRHVPSVIGATQSEEVGVEHLLRDINDPSVSTLAATIKHKVGALRGLRVGRREAARAPSGGAHDVPVLAGARQAAEAARARPLGAGRRGVLRGERLCFGV